MRSAPVNTIGQILWLIESRFRSDLLLDDLAVETNLSRFQVSRLFSLETGTTLTSFVRGRRLSEAAKALADGAPDIISVALDAGYSSHEAFTRAFRAQFGVT